MEISNKDWLLFKETLPLWQERYMKDLCYDYITILNSSDKPSKKFWELDERIKQDKKALRVIAEMKRQNAIHIMAALLYGKVIYENDLQGFSPELIETVIAYYKD